MKTKTLILFIPFFTELSLFILSLRSRKEISMINDNIEDKSLVERISEGDERAFRLLFDRYYLNLLHLAIYFLKSKELAEEAVADVFYTIWIKKESLQKVKDIKNYLYISTKNQALQYIRRAPVIDKVSIDLYTVNIESEGSDPEKKLLDKEYQKIIQEAILSLPEKCREVFRLVLSDKLKHKEIAQILNISEKTVEAHITTAYKRVASYVNKEYSKEKTMNKMLGLFF